MWSPADLLVLGVHAVVEASDGHHDDGLPGHVLEGPGHGDGPALADHIGLHVEHLSHAGTFIGRL